MSTKTDVGVLQQQKTGMLAGTPRDSALKAGQDDATRLNQLSKVVSGGRRRRKYKGGADPITVTPLKASYPNANGNQGVEQQNAALTATQARITANAVYDGNAKSTTTTATKGGSKRTRTKKSRKSKKSKKSRKYRKSRRR
jgi:hypothetical protein